MDFPGELRRDSNINFGYSRARGESANTAVCKTAISGVGTRRALQADVVQQENPAFVTRRCRCNSDRRLHFGVRLEG